MCCVSRQSLVLMYEIDTNEWRGLLISFRHSCVNDGPVGLNGHLSDMKSFQPGSSISNHLVRLGITSNILFEGTKTEK